MNLQSIKARLVSKWYRLTVCRGGCNRDNLSIRRTEFIGRIQLDEHLVAEGHDIRLRCCKCGYLHQALQQKLTFAP